MNERIRLLAEQAGIYKLDLSDETEYWIIEKFAELVMRDVCNKLEPVLAKEILQLYGIEV